MDYEIFTRDKQSRRSKKLKIEQLEEVCEDLREFIIDHLSHNPGHFGSSLGTVELTVALHYLYNTPYDRLVWDVGHQHIAINPYR